MKKLIAREFIWLMVNLVLAAPLAFLFLGSLDLVAAGDLFTEHEKTFVAQLYLLAYVFNFIGLYLVRVIVLAIKILVLPTEKSK